MTHENIFEKINITANVDEYSDNELEFRAIATLELMKLDSLDLIMSTLEKSGTKLDAQKSSVEILGFCIFNCWHITLKIFKNDEKANLFNAVLSETFKYEFTSTDQIFEKYYEKMPQNGRFDKTTWKFWLFGKELMKIANHQDANIVLKSVALMNYIIGSINRILNITLNLKILQLKEFMAMAEQEKIKPAVES